jgi:predicted dehydrogenase
VHIGLIGMGFMGATHLEALRKLPDVRLTVVTRDPRKLPEGAHGLSLEAALADPSIEAVDICLPTHLHAPVAIEALRAGKHVLVEKPMALDFASAESMAAEAALRGRILMTAHVLRFWPAYVALRETVRGGQFGGVRHARFERRSGIPAWGPWLLDDTLSGGGAFDLLIHDADMCLQLFGSPAQVAAVSYTERAGATLLDAQLYYPEMVAHISGGWQPSGAFPFRSEYTVTFERATAEYASLGRPATLYSAEETRALESGEGDPVAGSYAAEVAYFAECCRAGRAPEVCPPSESARAVALMRLLVEAAQRNGEKIVCAI